MFDCMIALLAALALQLPATTLRGEARVFPSDAEKPRAIFVITFSKAATNAAAEWTQKLREAKQPVFQVAVLEDVPRFLRGFVISSIRGEVPAALQDRFWIVAGNAQTWRTVVDAKDDKEPHVVLVENGERVTHVIHGAYSDEKLRGLR